LAAVLLAIFATSASAGVVPNHGGQSHSGAKVKPVSQNQESEKSDQAHEKEDAAKDDKR